MQCHIPERLIQKQDPEDATLQTDDSLQHHAVSYPACKSQGEQGLRGTFVNPCDEGHLRIQVVIASRLVTIERQHLSVFGAMGHG